MKSKLLILFLLLVFSSGFVDKPKGCLPMDIIVVGDFSASTEGKQEFVIGALHEFINRFELSEVGIKIGIVVFDYDPYRVSELSSNKDSLNQRIESLYNFELGTSTNMTTALYFSSLEFTKFGRENYGKLLIVISDGAVNNPFDTNGMADALKKSGIGICSVLIQDSSSRPQLMKIISSDCYLETNYENLITELKKLDVCL